MPNDHLGEFEHLVLLAILRLGEEAAGAGIRRVLKERGGRVASFGAIYSTLRRMETKGYLTAWEPTGEGEDSRARKRVRLTRQGLAVLRKAQSRLLNMSAGIPELDSLT